MRLEHLPLILGVLVALVGIGLVVDAVLADAAFVPIERRRRVRAERHKVGEGMVGIGMLGMAAALAGGDRWPYVTVAAIVGAVLLVIGAILNRRYLHELFTFRGVARRRPEGERQTGEHSGEKLRLR